MVVRRTKVRLICGEAEVRGGPSRCLSERRRGSINVRHGFVAGLRRFDHGAASGSRTGRAPGAMLCGGARLWRGSPLGAQRRGLREREDVLGGNRNVRVVRKAGVTRRGGNAVRQRDARGNEGDGRRAAAVPKAGALVAVLARRLLVRQLMMLGGRDRRAGMATTRR